MTSTIPAFKTALRDRLLAVPLSATIGAGDPAMLPEQAVIIGPAENRQLEWVCGMTQANETYTVEIMTSVVGSALETHEALVAIAWGINDQVVANVLAWKDTDFSGIVNSVMPTDGDDDEAVGDGWREAVVKQTLLVRGRI